MWFGLEQPHLTAAVTAGNDGPGGERERRREREREGERRRRETGRERGEVGGLVFPTGMQTPQKRTATPRRSPPCRAEGLGEVRR